MLLLHSRQCLEVHARSGMLVDTSAVHEILMDSLPEIGRRFGGRDHTTVLHAVRKIDELVKQDAQIAEDMELIKRQLNDA